MAQAESVNTTSRRSFLSSAGTALAIVPLATMPVLATPAGDLPALGRRFAELTSFCEGVRNEFDEAEELYIASRPQYPADAVIWRDSDFCRTGLAGGGAYPCPDRKYRYAEKAVEAFRAEPQAKALAQKRADEIVAAYDEWEAECDQLRSRICGAQEDRYDDAIDRYRDVMNQILATPARTITDLAVKASVVMWASPDFPGEDDPEADDTDRALRSIIRDLVRMA